MPQKYVPILVRTVGAVFTHDLDLFSATEFRHHFRQTSLLDVNRAGCGMVEMKNVSEILHQHTNPKKTEDDTKK